MSGELYWHRDRRLLKDNDPDKWMTPFRDGNDNWQSEESEEVKRLVLTLFNRRVLSRLKRVKTSLRNRRKRDAEMRGD